MSQDTQNTMSQMKVQTGRQDSRNMNAAPSRQEARVSRPDKVARDSSQTEAWDDSLTDNSDSMTGVRDRAYRTHCLVQNYIFIQNPLTRLPNAIQTHRTNFSHTMSRMPKLPCKTVESALQELEELGLGCNEDSVVDFWRTNIFPRNRDLTAPLVVMAGIHMDRHLLPDHPEAPAPVQQPRPDLLYGYLVTAFTNKQYSTLASLFLEPLSEPLLPFLVVEYKTGASPGSNLWVAANQCAGGSVASLQAADHVNAALVQAGGRKFLNICYSFAIDNHLAFLYLTRMNKGRFKMQRVDVFLLLRKEDFVRFHQCVATIFQWAEERLNDMLCALDTIRDGPADEGEGEDDEGDDEDESEVEEYTSQSEHLDKD